MEGSRPSSPEAPPENLWSSILDSVSSSRITPAKQILLLGQPSSGKSSLAAALLQKGAGASSEAEQRQDFALGYEWADIRDDADEDTLARLSVYEVPSAAPSYTTLLPHFVPPRTSLPHTVVMIVLDWTRPWTFMEELELWLTWIEEWTQGDGSRELEIVREENRERLQAHLQHYTEPSTEPLSTNSSLSSTLLPLGPGTFTHNTAGVPIMVVCTKADQIDESPEIAGAGAAGMGGMVKGKGGEWEERTDGVMQVLRTICLKYGAALFYTTLLPATLQVVRQYALHLLFAPPAPQPGTQTEAIVPARNLFPFQHKPNVLDRDHIVVPAGWDSWGKIGVLREGFDAKGWGEAWEHDINADEDEPDDGAGALSMFATLVPDESVKPPPLPAFNNPVPEQNFLTKHYDENAKKPDRDPRGAFRDPAASAAGVVGPLGSSSFSLPAVERALSEMEGASAGERASLSQSTVGDPAARKLPPARTGTTVRPSAAGLPPVGAGSRAVGVGPSGPSPPPNGQTQHEVLHNFFQSLLTSKDRAGAAAAVTKTAPTKAPSTTDNTDGPA